jgi:hypothetical protein
MDFAVANMVQQDNRPALAAPQLWNKMMQALRDMGRDWPAA